MTLAERGERVVLLSSCCSRLRRRPLKSVGGLKVRVPRYWMELKASGNRPSFLKRSWRRRSADSDGLSGEMERRKRERDMTKRILMSGLVNLMIWFMIK